MTDLHVTVNGVVYTSDTLEGLSIKYGRQALSDSFPAATCSLAVLARDEHLDLKLRDRLVVQVEGVTVFRGRLTDRTVDLQYVHGDHFGTVDSLVGVGPLGDLGRLTTGLALWPSELDGARAERILNDSDLSGPTIDSVSTLIDTTTYAFAYWNGAGLDTVDAGTVTLLERAASAATPRSLIDSGLDPVAPGVYETPDGKVGYADAGRRVSASNPLEIPADVIHADLTLGTSIGEIANSSRITYGNPSATVTADDLASQSIWGIVTKTLDTQLANETDAATLADRLVAQLSEPQLNLEAVRIDLNDPNVSPTLQAGLLGIVAGTPVSLTGLDSRLGIGETWNGYVEGWTLTLGQYRQTIELYISARRYSLPLATLDEIATALDALTGTVDDLAYLWSTQRQLRFGANDTLDNTGATFDAAYTIGA